MNKQELLTKYIEICADNLKENSKVLALLKNEGIFEPFLFENFNLGYADGNVLNMIGDNQAVLDKLTELGLLRNRKEVFAKNVMVPIYNENKVPVNLAFYNPYHQSKTRLQYLNESGIFNSHFLKNSQEVILTMSPLETLLLIQHNFASATFVFADIS